MTPFLYLTNMNKMILEYQEDNSPRNSIAVFWS